MDISELIHSDAVVSESRPFQCTFHNCCKAFGIYLLAGTKRNRALSRHPHLPYFLIGRRSDLARHSRIHTNERYGLASPEIEKERISTKVILNCRPFSCMVPGCGKSFIQVRAKSVTITTVYRVEI